jgi:hypothetical protein
MRKVWDQNCLIFRMNTLGAKNIHISVPVHCFYQHLLTDIWKFQSVLVYISKDTAKKCLYIYIWDILSVLYLENCINCYWMKLENHYWEEICWTLLKNLLRNISDKSGDMANTFSIRKVNIRLWLRWVKNMQFVIFFLYWQNINHKVQLTKYK